MAGLSVQGFAPRNPVSSGAAGFTRGAPQYNRSSRLSRDPFNIPKYIQDDMKVKYFASSDLGG